MKSNIKIISFDLYDTLIQRILPKEKIYLIIEKKLNILDFAKKRIDAEKNISNCQNGLYNLNDIYSLIDIDEISKNKALVLEEELEIQNTKMNYVGFDLYNKYSKKYQIICISDMYFSKNVIARILEKNGYSNINNIFVSCELMKSKRNRTIYSEVARILVVNNNEICHIGDSFRSDYCNAIIAGVNSIYIGKNKKNNYSKKLEKEKYLEYLGYNIFGPLMFEFCCWIEKNCNTDNLLFLSREGEIIFNCYNKIFENHGKMVYLSRKSVLSGITYDLIKKDKLSEIFNIISIKRNETVFELINRLGIEKNIVNQELGEKLVNNSSIRELMNVFYINKNNILSKLEVNSNLFKKYIEKEIYNNSTFVDVGWNGSMQNLIELYYKINEINININGLYLGCLNTVNKEGFLFNEESKISNDIMNYSGILELFLMPEYGSVIGYKNSKNEIVPVFDDIEFSDESMKNIKCIQKGIEQYVTQRKKICDKSLYTKDELCTILNSVGLFPNKRDIDYIGNIDFYDNGKKYLLVNVSKKLKKNFIESKWKVGFFKKLFKLKINYSVYLNFFRKLVDKNGKS